VVTELADDLWPAMVDPSQVEAALLNLCLNARDAMPEGGQLTITTANVIQSGQVAPDDPPPGPYVRITVADTGSGMTPDVQSRAFDPFFTTKGHGGSGLGLSQVYSMARQSNGAVRIHSLPDQGTEVALLLPRAASGVEAEPSRAAEAGRRSAPQGVALVVDDDHEVRQVTVEMLKDLGCDVVQAAGGAEALTMLDGLAAPPDLVLLDYAMPGMNGLQLASKLRERGIVAPMALVTGYAELADAEGTPPCWMRCCASRSPFANWRRRWRACAAAAATWCGYAPANAAEQTLRPRARQPARARLTAPPRARGWRPIAPA
jgi:CheY-like chemotaxis protein